MTGDLSEALDRLISEAENAPPMQSPPQPPTDSANPLGALLSNPEILSKLPVIMNAANGFLHAGKSTGAHTGGNHHAALLCALKPYLNSERQKAAEYIINFLRISEAMRSIPTAEPSGKKGENHVQ